MCFSASASFAAAGVTGVAGVAALRSASRPSHRLLAAIPVIFATHQFAEGILWLVLSGTMHGAWGRPAMFTFLAVGDVGWPFLVPLAILAVEGDWQRRKLLWGLLALGTAVAVVRAIGLVAYPVSATVTEHHIQYRLDTPTVIRLPTDVVYAVVTVLPLLICSIGLLRVTGFVVLASLVVSKLLFYETFISVWCFFAALISALLVVVTRRLARTPLEVNASPGRC